MFNFTLCLSSFSASLPEVTAVPSLWWWKYTRQQHVEIKAVFLTHWKYLQNQSYEWVTKKRGKHRTGVCHLNNMAASQTFKHQLIMWHHTYVYFHTTTWTQQLVYQRFSNYLSIWYSTDSSTPRDKLWAKTFILWGRTSLIRVESSHVCRWFDFFQTQIWRLVPLRLLCSRDVRLLTTCTFKCVFSVKVTLICVYIMLSWCV